MNEREQERLRLLEDVLEGQLTQSQAAKRLRISERQFRRLLKDFREKGAVALVHGNRGRKPHNAVIAATAVAVVVLAGESNPGLNHSKFTKLLAQRDDIHLGRLGVRRLLNRFGPVSGGPNRPPGHQVRRERLPQEGMLLNIYDRHHASRKAPRLPFALLLAMDDATATVANAVFLPEGDPREHFYPEMDPQGHFRSEEDTRGYFLLMEGVISRFGIPLAIHSVRRGAFLSGVNPRPINWHYFRRMAPSQFRRAMGELGLEHVFTHSPPAEERGERMAEDFKDRLVSELSRAGAGTIDQANAVLRDFWPSWNARYRQSAQEPQVAYRPLDSSLSLEWTLCFKRSCLVAPDNTFEYERRTLQLLPGRERPSYADVRVEVQERIDGRLMVQYGGKVVPHREAPPSPGAPRAS